MPLYLLLGFAFGLMLGYLLLSRRHRSRYLASAEYWVYIPGDTMPDQAALMSGIVQRRGIGRSEGLVMSDVRLNIGLVRRSINPSPFRPDLFADVETLTPRQLELLDGSQAFVRLRFTSEEHLPDKRHLRFLVHAADAIAEMAGGELIYDSTAEQLFDRQRLHEALSSEPDGTSADLHVRILWRSSLHGGWAETRGLRKVGREDLRTYESEPDERVLVTTVLEEASRQVWSQPDDSGPLQVDAYDDQFQVVLDPPTSGFSLVRILRVQTI